MRTRQERKAYEWREKGGIHCYDEEKGTNITEFQAFSPQETSCTIISSNTPFVVLRKEKGGHGGKG